VAFVKKNLGDSYKFDSNIELNLDPDQRKFAADAKEDEAFLTKFIHFQISNYMISDMKLPEAKKQLLHRYELIEKRTVDNKKEDLYSNFLDSFANAMDPHSSYLSKDVNEDFKISMRLSLEGIGASLSSQDGYTVVEELIPGGSAEKSGDLKAKDKIIGVAQGKDGVFDQVIDMPLREVVQKIRGAKGTTVKLNVLREGKGGQGTRRFEISLVRDKISLKEEAAKMEVVPFKVGKKNMKFAIIELPSFYMDFAQPKTKSCSLDVKALVKDAVSRKVDGILLDFSKNPGGSLTEAVNVAGLFMQKANVVATKDFRDRVEILDDRDSTVEYTGPLVVLSSRLSASASEIVAGALQDYKRALIVGGDHTFGKGTVQAVQEIDDGAIKLFLDQHRLEIDKKPVDLSPKEFDLLAALMRARNTVLTREVLCESVWGHELVGNTRTVDVHVGRLRKKLGKYETRIETVERIGYRYLPEKH
jgi:carboxyl-terminal processing protease